MHAERVFVDANTIVSGLLFEGNESMLLELGAFRAVELVTNHYVLSEVRRVLRRVEFGLTEKEIQNLIGYLHQAVLIADDPSEAAVRACADKLTDKKDGRVWAGYESSGASHLVTGDKELLEKVDGALRTSDSLRMILKASG